MKHNPPIANAGEAGARFYSALTGIAPPRNDNATTGNRGEVGTANRTAGKTDYSGKKRLPAYGRDLLAHRRAGREPYHRGSTLHPDFRPFSESASSAGAGLKAATVKVLWWHVCNSHP